MLGRWEPFVSSGGRGDFSDELTRIQGEANRLEQDETLSALPNDVVENSEPKRTRQIKNILSIFIRTFRSREEHGE